MFKSQNSGRPYKIQTKANAGSFKTNWIMKNKTTEEKAREYALQTYVTPSINLALLERRVAYDSYQEGFAQKQKETVKILLDLKNEYKSKLSEQRIVKLGKRIDLETEMVLEAYIEVIDKVLKKLQ